MANKKYIDFSAGTYDTTKIFLQADATTGALEKINLPSLMPFKLFLCNLLQSGTGDPTMTILVNQCGSVPSCTRFNPGQFLLDFTSNELSANTIGLFSNPGSIPSLQFCYPQDLHSRVIITTDLTGSPSDSITANVMLALFIF